MREANSRRLRVAALYRAASSYPLLEEATPSLGVAVLLATDALTRLYGACAVTWFLPILLPKLAIPRLVPEPDPGPLLESGVTMTELEEALLGGIFKQLTELRDQVTANKSALRLQLVEQHVTSGLREGLAALLERRSTPQRDPSRLKALLE